MKNHEIGLHIYFRTDYNSRYKSVFAYMLHFFFQVLSVFSTIERSAATKQCFDLKDTLFVRNRWDAILDFGKQKRDLLKTKLTDQMKTKWPWVRESQIFDLGFGKV